MDFPKNNSHRADPTRKGWIRQGSFRNVIGGAIVTAMTTTSVLAVPAITSANVNFREGPGTSYPRIGTLDEGSSIEVLQCTDSGSWCAIEADGQNGFVSGRYIQEVPSEDKLGWPRAYDVGADGNFIVLHEPQFSEWTDFRTLDAVIAAEFHANEEASPIFGVIGLRADTVRDSTRNSIILSNISLTQVDFASLERDQISKLSLGLGGLLPTAPIEVRQERIVAGLANYNQVSDVEGVRADPPVIYYSITPAKLVQTDGPAIFAPVRGVVGLEFALNTNWDLFRANDILWLRDEKTWLSALDIDGEWREVTELPEALSSLPDDGNWVDARASVPPTAYDAGAPTIFVSDMLAELILFDGSPVYEDVPGGDLEWASNTESDLFRLKSTGVWYYLVSGRWFSTSYPDGPWDFATPDLPVDFQFIPADKPYYTVRASVPGTSEANEARLRASIPEVARININEIDAPVIEYGGEPAFEPIEGTDLNYSVNTGDPVIDVNGRYFVVIDGVWFESDGPQGPWSVATNVPEAIYEIPPSSPVHNVTYVHVYDSDDDGNVSVGYTAGYLFGFMAWGVFVHGSGWYYPPYWHHHPHRPIYYPRPVSFGSAAYYNPAIGTFGRYGYAYGPYRGIQARTLWNPSTGRYVRAARYEGPVKSGGYVSAVNPRTGTRAIARGGSDVYGRWGQATVRRGADYLNVNARQGNLRTGARWESSRGQGAVAYGRRGNVYAGRDGNVYRRSNGEWQRWNDSGWGNVQRPERGVIAPTRPRLSERTPGTIRNNPTQRVNPTNRVQRPTTPRVHTPVPRHVNRDYRNRGVANERSISQNVNRSNVGRVYRPAGGARPRRR
ncbi:SH3 domain-containing protein [Pseudohalocynthiibacter aestuariivivens]|uniref:SH3 domain-containing protein n=1 Tax=Pseudohalocynthiibacter aestuariivivens TaxID=1591409 RepID=A0ABV5JEE1_9RHOB|nr:SH3 domain-containing protein [Pseudohalocynthiibacter aestuariivivens]MBS9718836.1 SH3 domain-containing protein [Pseudohalocynthiibacter aestuariivivens]